MKESFSKKPIGRESARIGLIRENLDSYGGAERVMCTLANELVYYYDVHIINHYYNESCYILSGDIYKFFLHKNKMRLRRSIINDVCKLRKYIIENKINKLILVGRTSVLTAIIACTFTNTKVIFFDQMSLNSYNFQKYNFRGKVYNFIVQFFIKYFTDMIVVLTQKTKSEYKKLYSINSNKIKVINNFIEERAMNYSFDYDKESKKIITVGRIDYAKGYEFLIKVAKKVFLKNPDWEWHIYGDTFDKEYKEKIIELIFKENLENKVILKGNNSNIYEVYNEYAFLVMTSRHEGFGMVLVEAKAKKLPLVSFDINSGPSDIIRDGVDGYLVKPFDVDEMTNKICDLIEHPELRKLFSDNAYGNLDKFMKENIIRQWYELINNV